MDGLKQRIIGALVLVSLAVIFVPMIFDEPHSGRVSSPIQIPEEPPFPEVSVPVDSMPEPPEYEENKNISNQVPATPQPENTADAEPSPGYRLLEKEAAPVAPSAASESLPAQVEEPVAAPEATNTEEKAQSAGPVPAAEDTREQEEFSRSLAGAWVVQLGSFGNPDNARRLRDKVRAKGYGSHLQEVTRGDTTLTRVFAGPFANRTEAEAAKKALDGAFSLNSLVTEAKK